MCTLTWDSFPGGYELHFNRDESRLRAKAELPSIFTKSGISIIAPRDPEAGGTWISVNQTGLSLCLLNNYGAAVRYQGHISRGLLVDDLAQAATSEEVRSTLATRDIQAYSPFDLICLSTDSEAVQISWDGQTVSQRCPTESFLSSSGFDTKAVIAGRRKQYKERTTESLFDYHRSHLPARSAYSVCMHRPDAKTLSYTRIRVDSSHCRLWYADGSPCSSQLQSPLSLTRLPVLEA